MPQCCICFFFLRKVHTQWFYYFPVKAAGKLRCRQNRGDARENPQVTLETGTPGMLVLPEEAPDSTPPLFVISFALLFADLKQVIRTVCNCAGEMAAI